jgi:hypothetical protein
MDRLSAWTGSGHGPAQLLSALKATSHEGHLGTDSWGSRLASSRIVMVCRYPLHGQIAIMKSPRSAQTSTTTSTTVTYNKRDGMATNSWPVAHNAYHSLILHAAEVDAYACIHSFCAGTALTPCITRTRMAHAGYKCKGEVAHVERRIIMWDIMRSGPQQRRRVPTRSHASLSRRRVQSMLS